MASDIIIRPLFGRILSVMVALIVLVSVVSLVAGNRDALSRYIWPLLLFGVLAWLAFWYPRVIIGDEDVRLVNVFRTIVVPLETITGVDTRFALTLLTSRGRFVAWAAPAPGRHAAARTTESDARGLPKASYVGGTVRAADVPTTDSGDAATMLRQRLAEREARQPGTSGETVRIRLHVVSLIIVGLLVLATVLGVVL